MKKLLPKYFRKRRKSETNETILKLRLTPERLATMQIGGDFREKQIFVDILFVFEGASAFDDSEMGLLNPAIEPPAVVHTVPHRETFECEQNLLLSTQTDRF